MRGPDGEANWIAIACRGSQMRCVERAGEACPAGYEVAESLGHEGQSSRSFATVDRSGGHGFARSESTYDGELLVKCKGAPSAEASDPRRFRACMSSAECDVTDECAWPSVHAWDDPGRCRPQNR